MTEQQFKRACEIKERLNGLERVKSYFRSGTGLRYTYLRAGCERRVCSDSNEILDLLDEHDKMIRQEIEDEIESLKKEIEKL